MSFALAGCFPEPDIAITVVRPERTYNVSVRVCDPAPMPATAAVECSNTSSTPAFGGDDETDLLEGVVAIFVSGPRPKVVVDLYSQHEERDPRLYHACFGVTLGPATIEARFDIGTAAWWCANPECRTPLPIEECPL